MPQSRDRKEFYINMDHCSVEEIKDFVNKLTPEKPLLFNAPIKFITEVRESAAWMDSGGYLHAVPKENKK